MQIRTGLHSQLSDVRGKKHPYFKARMIRSRITPRPGPVPVWADDRWKIAQNRAAGSEAATQEPQACGGLQARSPGNRCLWNSPSAEATQAAHTPTGKVRVVPPGSAKHQGKITASVHCPRWCPSAGVWHTAVPRVGFAAWAKPPQNCHYMVLRVVLRKPLPGYFSCGHVQQKNIIAEWPFC